MEDQNIKQHDKVNNSRIDFWGPGGHLHYSAEFEDKEAASLFLEDVLDPSLDSNNGPYYLHIWDLKVRRDKPCYHFSLRDIPDKLAAAMRVKKE